MQYAIVTGATQGIGKAIAEKLLKEGFSIIISARSAAKLGELSDGWQEEYPGAEVVPFPADLGIKEQAIALGNFALSTFPKIDVLVNNAGTFTPGDIGDEPDGRLEELMAVNLFSAYHLSRTVLGSMKKARSGHIFNMCSVASLRAYPNGGSYSISKYALLGFSDNLREELKPHNIKVTAICPGATYTPSWEGSGVEADRIMDAGDIAHMLFGSYQLSPQANVEHIILRPVKGDL